MQVALTLQSGGGRELIGFKGKNSLFMSKLALLLFSHIFCEALVMLNFPFEHSTKAGGRRGWGGSVTERPPLYCDWKLLPLNSKPFPVGPLQKNF